MPDLLSLNGARLRELAHREADGIDVWLLWDPGDGAVAVRIADIRSNEVIELPARPEDALKAFYHPFAYARLVGA